MKYNNLQKQLSMNKIIKTISIVSFLLITLISAVHGQTTEEQKEAMEHNQEIYESMLEAELEDGFSIFNSTNLKISFTCFFEYENFTDELEPYNPQKENFEDITGKSGIGYGLKDRKQYLNIPEYIEFKPTPDSKPERVQIDGWGFYTCYVFYISEGQLKLGKHNN